MGKMIPGEGEAVVKGNIILIFGNVNLKLAFLLFFHRQIINKNVNGWREHIRGQIFEQLIFLKQRPSSSSKRQSQLEL